MLHTEANIDTKSKKAGVASIADTKAVVAGKTGLAKELPHTDRVPILLPAPTKQIIPSAKTPSPVRTEPQRTYEDFRHITATTQEEEPSLKLVKTQSMYVRPPVRAVKAVWTEADNKILEELSVEQLRERVKKLTIENAKEKAMKQQIEKDLQEKIKENIIEAEEAEQLTKEFKELQEAHNSLKRDNKELNEHRTELEKAIDREIRTSSQMEEEVKVQQEKMGQLMKHKIELNAEITRLSAELLQTKNESTTVAQENGRHAQTIVALETGLAKLTAKKDNALKSLEALRTSVKDKWAEAAVSA